MGRKAKGTKGSEDRRPYRQGDVLLVPCDAGMEHGVEVKRDPVRGLVLAVGEATGHMHHIQAPVDAAALFDISPDKLDRLLEVRMPVTLYHDEHAPIGIDPGSYVVRRQREYTPQGLRTVED